MDVAARLHDFYFNLERNRIGAARDVMFSTVDSLLRNSQFDECDQFISSIDINRLDTFMCVALLSITLSGRDHLKQRAAIVTEIENHLSQIAPNRKDNLLLRLR